LNKIDYLFFFLIGASAVAAAYSFAIVEKYLIAHGLVNRNVAYPNVMDFYKKYAAHTKTGTGRTARWLWIHICSAGVFIASGMAYVIFRFVT